MARHGWNSMRDLMTLQERMNRLFEDAAERRAGRKEHAEEGEGEMERADWIPAADVYEDDGEYTIALDLPGIRRDQLEVDLDEGRLTIRGERPAQAEAPRTRRSERPVGRFIRSFSLPDAVDRGSITADYKDGVLHLHLPKRQAQTPRRVEIKVQ